MLTLDFVLETLSLGKYGDPGRLITTVVIDSREARDGSLFVAFEGESVDGHDYVADAFERGAIAALVDKELPGFENWLDGRSFSPKSGQRPVQLNLPICLLVDDTLMALQALGQAWRAKFEKVRVIGITGSVGKTSTKELTHAVLSRRFRTLKSEGNYNNEIGLPLTLLKLRPWHERAVLEMGMYTSGEISLLCDLAKPHVGVVTIVGSVHMEWLGSIEAIAAAKQELVEALPPGPDGVAILNKDDPRVMAMADKTPARVFTYGLDQEADVWADNITSQGLDGIKFSLHYRRDRLNIQVPLLGRHSVHTALRAAAAGLVEEMNWDDIVRGLRGLTSQLRLVAATGPKDSIILDDTYNSSPESAVAALNLLAELEGRRVAVMGDMLELGPVEESSHRLVGRRTKEVAQVLVAVGPRARWISEEAVSAGMPVKQVVWVPDASAAVEVLTRLIEPNDVILVKGSRGIQLDQVVTALEQN